MKRFFLRSVAFNSIRHLANVLVGAATNADAVTIADESDGWLRLAPYGETPYWHEQEPGDWKKFRQIFQKPQAETMVAAFNAVSAKKGARFKGLPIYAGHPDTQPDRYPDQRRFGGVMGLEARADGLYAHVAWNDLGAQNQAQGYLVYPSPAWMYDTKAAKQTGIIAPDELRSVGLTNSPRIQDSVPWVNTDDPGAPEDSGATTDTTTTSQADANNPTSMIEPKKMLTGLLGLKDDASDEDIQSAHDAHMDVKDAKDKLEKAHTKLSKAYDKHSEALAALQDQKTAANSERDAALEKFRLAEIDVTTAKAEATNAAAARDAARQKAAVAMLDNAIYSGRISAAERPELERGFATNFDETAGKIGERKPALNTKPLGLKLEGGDLSTPALRSFAYNSRANELKRTLNLASEDAVANAMRSDDQGKSIIAAMDAAAK